MAKPATVQRVPRMRAVVAGGVPLCRPVSKPQATIADHALFYP